MDAIDALKTRRSIRTFTPDPIEKAVVEDILDCGRLAASARNVQPWAFVVVTDGERRARLAELSVTGAFIADAPVCVCVLCQDTKYYIEDGSAATQNMLVAAHAHGLGACWVAGDKKPHATEIADFLGAPEGYRLLSLVAIGYPEGPPPSPTKRPLEEAVHWECF